MRVWIARLGARRSALTPATPPHLLPNLIGHCFIMCGAIDGYELGVGSQGDLVESIQNVGKSSSDISKAVLALIESGDLVVQDGTIVNPNPDDE